MCVLVLTCRMTTWCAYRPRHNSDCRRKRDGDHCSATSTNHRRNVDCRRSRQSGSLRLQFARIERGLQLLEIVPQVLCRLIPVLEILRQRAPNDARKIARECRCAE